MSSRVLRRAALGFGALAAVALGSTSAHAEYDTIGYVQFPPEHELGKPPPEQGLVVQLHSLRRFDKGGDNDWGFKLGPAACDGAELYGRNCEVEFDRFLQVFWDDADANLRKLVHRFVKRFANHHQSKLAAAGLKEEDRKCNSNKTCRTLYGRILANIELWELFSNYRVDLYEDLIAGDCDLEWCVGDDFKPAAEVTLTNEGSGVELDRGATQRKKGRSIYEFFQDGGRDSDSPMVHKNILIHGMKVVDDMHPRRHIIGKVEIHPLHGIVFRDGNKLTHGADGNKLAKPVWAPGPTTTVISLADAGKASGNGIWPIAAPITNYVYEEWPESTPYFKADLSFLNQPLPLEQTGPGNLMMGYAFPCLPTFVDGPHNYAASAFGITPPGITTECPTHTFMASFRHDFNPRDVVLYSLFTLGIGLSWADKYPFVEPGWGVHEYTPSWLTADITSKVKVTKLNGIKFPPNTAFPAGLFPGVPAEAVDVYEATFEFGNLPEFKPGVRFEPIETKWKLPPERIPNSTKVISFVSWKDSPMGGMSFPGWGPYKICVADTQPPLCDAMYTRRGQTIRFGVLRAPERNPLWNDYPATIQGTTTLKAGLVGKPIQSFQMEALPVTIARQRPRVKVALVDSDKDFRIETQVLEGPNVETSNPVCSPSRKTRIVYEPKLLAIPTGFVDNRNGLSTFVKFAWRHGEKVLSMNNYTGPLPVISIRSDDPFLGDKDSPRADERFDVSVWDKTVGGPLEKATADINQADFDIPLTKVVFTASKGLKDKPLSTPLLVPVTTPAGVLHPGCNDSTISKLVVKTFATFQLDAELTIPKLATSAYRSKEGKSLPPIQCQVFDWKVETMNAEGDWVNFPRLKSAIEGKLNAGYFLSEGDSRITIYTAGKLAVTTPTPVAPGRHSFRLTVNAHDGYGRSDSETITVNNWWAEWAPKDKDTNKKQMNTAAFVRLEAMCLQQKAEAMRKMASMNPKQLLAIEALLGPIAPKGGDIDPAPWMRKAAAKGPLASGGEWSNKRVAKRFGDLQKIKQALGDSPKP